MPEATKLSKKFTISLKLKLLGKEAAKIIRTGRAFIPGDPEPIELPKDILKIFGLGAEAIGVIDAQPQRTARLAHHQPGEDEIDRVAEMKQAAGGGSYAGTDHHRHSPSQLITAPHPQ